MTVQKKAKTRYSQIVLWLVLVACSTAAGQESATLTADAIVKARETVNFVITLDKAPNFEGGSIQLNVAGPETTFAMGIGTKPGERVYRSSFQVPAGAAGGTWNFSYVGFSTGTRTVELVFKKLAFEVIANPNLIYPTSAEVTVNPSQVQ